MQILEVTIDPAKLSLGDWLKIAEARGFKSQWAYKSWVECTSPEILAQFSLETWEAIAGAIDCSESWAYHRYKEYYRTKNTPQKATRERYPG